mgnify:CR=1 FL=1
MIYRTDYHIHTDYSDGKARPEEYIDIAVKKGFSEIGFSEHLNLEYNDLEWCMNPAMVDDYIKNTNILRKSRSDILIKTGLEVDFFPGREKEIAEFLKPYSLDYIIGSVHYMGTVTIDNSEDFFKGKDTDKLFDDYFSLVYEAVSSELFDLIAHCDLIRIYGHNYSSNPKQFYRNLAILMAKHNVAFEINTNGRNRPLGEFYPDVRFIHLFREANVPVCVNSDAHLPARVGQYFDEAYKIIKDAGYTEMCIFNKRQIQMIPVP